MTEKTAFIISPIGPRSSEIRIHFDKVRKHIIDPVAFEKGYTTLRSDEITLPGRITSQIIDHLKNDDLVIADLSRKNPNVYYELAIRHAVQKPVILMGENELDIPFDLSAQRVVPYSLDPDDIVTAKEQLTSQITSVESKSFQVDSPITDTIDLTQKKPRTEEDSIQRILAILETQSHQIQQLRTNQSGNYPGFIVDAGLAARRDWESTTGARFIRLISTLKPRDIDILRYLSGPQKKYSSIKMSEDMGLSRSTINFYLRRLVKMDLINRNAERPITYSVSKLGHDIIEMI